MIRTIVIKFDGQLIRTEMPLPNLFTGNITLSFNWKDGRLLVAQASKTFSADIQAELSPTSNLQNETDNIIIEK